MRKILYTLLFVPLIIFGQEQDPCYSINNFITQQNIINPPISYQLSGGWNMVGYTGTAENSGIANQINSALSNDSSIESTFQIIKNVSGQFWSSNFAQLLSFTQGEGYMMYVISETATSLSFNNPINIPEIIGCTDCEAINFNQWANVDDGSCNYDSDGDGVPDSEEIVGCQDSLACNFDETATDSGECTYAQDGYDCNGELIVYVGLEAYGGMVFYYNEIGGYGLVAAPPLNEWYSFGCSGVEISGADGYGLGWGMQNTVDIINDCNESEFAAKICYEYYYNGFEDWFLPSAEEFDLLDNSIGVNSASNLLSVDEQHGFKTSTEISANQAYMCHNYSNGIGVGDKGSDNVIPIRAFGNWTQGCMDTTACNYNPEANMTDGNCAYNEMGYDCDGNLTELVVGMNALGGVVFHIDETGESGLIAAIEDIEGLFEWGCYGTQVDGADQLIIGSGYENTIDIFNQGCTPNSGNEITAAQACLDYEYSQYDDWYLPSIDELELMYNTIGGGGPQDNSGDFLNDYYWSSSEWGHNDSWYVNFSDGTVNYIHPPIFKMSTIRVRAIRSFGITNEGCTDEAACNYNSEPFIDDGSCEYAVQGYDCDGNVYPYSVGQESFGGVVFYIDETGQHGLVAAMEDFGQMYWGCNNYEINGAEENGIGWGLQNSLDIQAGCSESPIAAVECLNYQVGDYDNWYLPSKSELYLMRDNISQNTIAPFEADENYWSSSERNQGTVWISKFNDGWMPTNGNSYGFKATTHLVRPIRTF